MLDSKDISGFYAELSQLNRDDYLLIDYLFETDENPQVAAAQLACEQSTVQWTISGESIDLRGKFGAKVIELKMISSLDQPKKFQCQAQIAHPIINFGPRIPNLLSAIAGEGPFYCPGILTIKIVDLHFPPSFLNQFEGPQFGIKGVREILKVFDRPIFVGVIKPNLGLTPENFAQRAYEAWLGGLDICKDDEMLADTSYSSIVERCRLTGLKRKQAARETNKEKIYIASITDEVDQLERLVSQAIEGGANTLMVNPFFTGLPALRFLRKKSSVPLMAHFSGMALWDRSQNFGLGSVPLVKLQRLSGADIIGIPGFGPRMKSPPEEVLANMKACLEPMGPIKPVLPIPGGSDWAGTLASVFEKIGHVDFGFISGRGVFGHPEGPRAGAQTIHQAWEAIHGLSPHSL